MNMNELSEQEKNLVNYFRALSPEARARALANLWGIEAENEDDVEENYQVTLQLHGTCIIDVLADDVEDAIAKARAEIADDITADSFKAFTRIVDIEYLLVD